MTGYRHGYHNTKTYRAWQQAKKRCCNPRDKDYPSYGGRGITFDPQWGDFVSFLRDMGECPTGFTLGRKDNDAGYCKANCEWQPWTMQARNKRDTRYLIIDGVKKSVPDWADTYGVALGTIKQRLRAGWSVERAVRP